MSQGTKLTFFAPGRPRPKARHRMTTGARAYTPKATEEWQSCVGWSFKAEHTGHELFPKDLPLAVELDFRFFTSHWSKIPGDLDNYEKAVLDALNRVAWDDDKQVVEKLTRKRAVQNREEEGVWVAIRVFTPSSIESGSSLPSKQMNTGC